MTTTSTTLSAAAVAAGFAEPELTEHTVTPNPHDVTPLEPREEAKEVKLPDDPVGRDHPRWSAAKCRVLTHQELADEAGWEAVRRTLTEREKYVLWNDELQRHLGPDDFVKPLIGGRLDHPYNQRLHPDHGNNLPPLIQGRAPTQEEKARWMRGAKKYNPNEKVTMAELLRDHRHLAVPRPEFGETREEQMAGGFKNFVTAVADSAMAAQVEKWRNEGKDVDAPFFQAQLAAMRGRVEAHHHMQFQRMAAEEQARELGPMGAGDARGAKRHAVIEEEQSDPRKVRFSE